MKNILICALALSVLLAVPARAQDISAAFCDALKNESAYDKAGLHNYKLLIPGKDGWVLRTSVDFKKDFHLEPKTIAYLKTLQDGFKAHGTDLVIVFPPVRGMVHSDIITAEQTKAYGFENPQEAWDSYLNMINELKGDGINIAGISSLPAGQSFFYKRDHHWNPDGAKLSAQSAATLIKSLPAYAQLTKTSFITKELGISDYRGTFEKTFKKLCNTDLPPEQVQKYATERSEAQSGDNALFGDSTAEIVLLGTSNTAPDPNVANFDGFLKEALSADVLNLSVSGAGADSSLLSYINSPAFHATPAKIAVWEIPGYYELGKMDFKIFQQAIPALQGDCEAQAVASAKDVALSGKTVTVLDKLADKNISGDQYYVHLNFSKPVMHDFSMELTLGEKADKRKFERSDRYPNPDGNFYALLKEKMKAPLETVTLNVPKELQGMTVSAQICKVTK